MDCSNVVFEIKETFKRIEITIWILICLWIAGIGLMAYLIKG